MLLLHCSHFTAPIDVHGMYALFTYPRGTVSVARYDHVKFVIGEHAVKTAGFNSSYDEPFVALNPELRPAGILCLDCATGREKPQPTV